MKQIDFIQPSMEEWLKSFSFATDVKIRFSETDAFGHVNNVSHIIYLEQARLDFFEQLNLFFEFLDPESTTFIVAADIHCHYLSQIYYTQRLSVAVKIARIGRSSLDLHYAILNKKTGTPLAVARGAIVHVDKSSGKSTPWPEEIKARMESSLSFS